MDFFSLLMDVPLKETPGLPTINDLILFVNYKMK